MEILLDDRFYLTYIDLHRLIYTNTCSPLRDLLIHAANRGKLPHQDIAISNFYKIEILEDALDINKDNIVKLFCAYSHAYDEVVVYDSDYEDNYVISYNNLSVGLEKREGLIYIDNLSNLYYTLKEIGVDRFFVAQEIRRHSKIKLWHCELR